LINSIDSPSDITLDFLIVETIAISVVFLPAERTVTSLRVLLNNVSWENVTIGRSNSAKETLS